MFSSFSVLVGRRHYFQRSCWDERRPGKSWGGVHAAELEGTSSLPSRSSNELSPGRHIPCAPSLEVRGGTPTWVGHAQLGGAPEAGGLEAGAGFHQKPQSPPGTMVVTAWMSGLKSFFSTNSLCLQLQVFIVPADPSQRGPQARLWASGRGPSLRGELRSCTGLSPTAKILPGQICLLVGKLTPFTTLKNEQP